MAKTLSYLDLSFEQRREAAKRYRAQLRQQLSTAEVGTSEYQVLLSRLNRVSQWEKGTLEVTPRTGVDHAVSVVEAVPVKVT